MCGLVAILASSHAHSPVDRDELIRMRDAMTARGPDGCGSWISRDGQIGLGHRRLAIVDLSEAGTQPMVSASGRFHIVFNGEIYNYRQLRTELEGQGAAFHTESDTEVVLQLYETCGLEALKRLRGMFAIALWDEAEQGLLLARDHLGIKPLYVADDGKTLRAASQVKALLAGGEIDTSPDPAGHAGFFLWGHVPEPHTLFKAVKALPAGSWLWAGRDGARREGHFFDLREILGRPSSDANKVDVRAALLDSVRSHLVADVPVGVFLSSGLDSTTLTALAAEIANTPIRTITLGFQEFVGTARDEGPLAEHTARHFGTDHQTSRVTAAEFANCRERLMSDMDQPSIDGVNTWFVARAARAHGLKVALSGVGGDELFAGYDSFRQIPKLVKALAAFRALPGLGRLTRIVTAPWIHHFAPPKAAGLLELGTSYGDAYLLRRGLFMPWELPGILGPDMAREGWRALAPRLALETATAGIANVRMKISALEMAFYMRNQLLRDADWAGMAHSLEIRTPLVDATLLEQVLPALIGNTPPGKLDMAESARPRLPREILDRPKTGFFVPVAQWLGENNLRGWAKSVHADFSPHTLGAGFRPH